MSAPRPAPDAGFTLVEAERRMKVLEHLEEKTRQAWKAELNKEVEDFAGEAFLARRIRESRSSGSSRD